MAMFERSIRLLPILLLGAAVAACAGSPTPYQAADAGYGYSEQQLEDDRYRITFAGNSATPREAVQNYMLFRAAEVTLESGHDYFTVVDQQIEGTSSGVARPRVGVGVGSGGSTSLGVGLSTFLGGNDTGRYTAYADIVVRDGEKPATDPDSYEARDLIERLRPTLAQPEA
ncbi:MAG TPA: hypothetical protein VFZ01_12590 [Geminicoccaceae bacterium]